MSGTAGTIFDAQIKAPCSPWRNCEFVHAPMWWRSSYFSFSFIRSQISEPKIGM